MSAIIILDTETFGLKPDRHAIWEIAWRTAVTSDAELRIVREFQTFVDISALDLLDADPAALRIGRFDERFVPSMADGVEFIKQRLMDDCSEVAEMTGETVPHLVGAVPSFDHAMLARWFGWPGYGENIWHYHLVCVETLAAGNLRVQPPYRSDGLTALLNIDVDESRKHTALGDVDWAMKMYAAVYDLTIITSEEK